MKNAKVFLRLNIPSTPEEVITQDISGFRKDDEENWLELLIKSKTNLIASLTYRKFQILRMFYWGKKKEIKMLQ